MKDVIAKPEDLAPAGLCLIGARRWAAERNFDFRQFIRAGVSAASLRATGCPYAVKLAEQAELRAAQEDVA